MSQQQSVHGVIVRNSLANALRYLVVFATALYITPYIIKSIGDAQYGFWALIFSILGYAGLLDMGIQMATIKLVAQYNKQGDAKQLSALCSTVLLFFVVIGAVASLACWFALPPLMPRFVSDPPTLAISGRILAILGVDVLFVFLCNVFVGISLGLQQYHIRGLIDMISAVVKLAGTIAVLRLGMGLTGLTMLKLGLDILTTGAMLWTCLRGNKQLRLSPFLANKASFMETFQFGSKLLVSSTMTRINAYTIPVIIATALSTTFTAYYNAASSICGFFKEILYSLTASFLPIFSALLSSGEEEAATRLYFRYSRFILLLTLPGYALLYLSGPAILEAWINPQYAEHGGPLLRLLVLAALLDGLQPLAGRTIIGGGRLKAYVAWTSCATALSIAGSFVLVPRLGIVGTGWSLCGASAMNLVIVTAILRKYPGIPAGRYLRALLGLVPPTLLFCWALDFFGATLSGTGLTGIVLRALPACGVYAACAAFSLTGAERDAVRAYVRKLAGREDKAPFPNQPRPGKVER